ncbi:hypothetical protein [Streptomyces antimicrobicus]|uniref:Uncharacterized protein n=1 Tax=Streptomyces antimicrobicus TaxID=2883108 RepID=A0ABS8B3K3_9ACTN|nr:hypothetical protein [Streptomyces antimicrobicus]MCB5179189.1 hypothetical protein [Streptomyces antimicrobicus]
MKTQPDTQSTSRRVTPEDRVRTCRPALLRRDCCMEPPESSDEAGFEANVVRGED